MIDYLKGQIAELTPARAVIECGGVGYEAHISLTTYNSLEGLSDCKIYVYEVIREDAHLLFGFAARDERELFTLLTSVSGVGPNTALVMLSSMKPDDLVNAIASGDDAILTTIKGIGSKTAQRIVVDLRNKVKINAAAATVAERQLSPSSRETAENAISALVTLGFTRPASQKIVAAVIKQSPDAGVEYIIKEALKMS